MANDPFEYDVAISYASEDQAIAEELKRLMVSKHLTVFLDENNAAEAWRNKGVDHLVNLYARKARYCLMLISQQYPLQSWTNHERIQAQERAYRDANEYILPIQLDDREVPGIAETSGYRDLRQHSVESVVDFLEQKLAQTLPQSGTRFLSHDLRSGNVPPAHPKGEEP